MKRREEEKRKKELEDEIRRNFEDAKRRAAEEKRQKEMEEKEVARRKEEEAFRKAMEEDYKLELARKEKEKEIQMQQEKLRKEWEQKMREQEEQWRKEIESKVQHEQKQREDEMERRRIELETIRKQELELQQKMEEEEKAHALHEKDVGSPPIEQREAPHADGELRKPQTAREDLASRREQRLQKIKELKNQHSTIAEKRKEEESVLEKQRKEEGERRLKEKDRLRLEEEAFRKQMENEWRSTSEEHVNLHKASISAIEKKVQENKKVVQEKARELGGEAPVSCPICNQEFMNERILGIHVDDWHKSDKAHAAHSHSHSHAHSQSHTKEISSQIADKLDLHRPDRPGRHPKPGDHNPSFATIRAPPENRDRNHPASHSNPHPLRISPSAPLVKPAAKPEAAAAIASASTSAMISPHKKDPSPRKTLPPPVPKRVITTERAAVLMQALWRGIATRKKYKPHLFRAKVAREILTSENTYVSSLGKVMEVLIRPLRASLHTGQKLVTEDELRSIFINLDSIFEWNVKFSQKLEPLITHWTLEKQFASFFSSTLREAVPLYSEYAKRFENSFTTVEKLMKERSSFKNFWKGAEREFVGNDINSYLILPIQRFPRYVLLIKEVLKFTPTTHPDYEALQVAAAEVDSMGKMVNEEKRVLDTDKQMTEDLKRIKKLIEPKLKDLDKEGRRLIKEGIITQYDPDSSKRKERTYYLFSDILLFVQPKPKSKKQVLKIHVTLENVKLEDMQDGGVFLGQQLLNAFILHTARVSLLLFCSSAEEKNTLLTNIRNILADLQKSKTVRAF